MKKLSLEIAKNEILKFVKDVDEDSMLHAFECLNQDYYDSGQKKSKLQIIYTIVMGS